MKQTPETFAQDVLAQLDQLIAHPMSASDALKWIEEFRSNFESDLDARMDGLRSDIRQEERRLAC